MNFGWVGSKAVLCVEGGLPWMLCLFGFSGIEVGSVVIGAVMRGGWDPHCGRGSCGVVEAMELAGEGWVC